MPNLFRGKDQGHHHHHHHHGNSQSGGAQQQQEPRKLGYRSMVSVDDVPELFASLDSKYYYYLTFSLYKHIYIYSILPSLYLLLSEVGVGWIEIRIEFVFFSFYIYDVVERKPLDEIELVTI